MARRPIVIAFLLAAIAVVAACASASGDDNGLGEAKAFKKFPIYWAGLEVAGFPLEEISTGPGGATAFYGSCELSGTDHPSCAPPIEVQQVSTCDRWASELNDLRNLGTLRGARASWHKGIQDVDLGEVEAGPLEIFTGRETIVIFVEEGGLEKRAEARRVAFEVARKLRTVRQARPTPLPPPVPGSLEGKLACQGKGH
jgi:hypothetical protein